jgi:hypothetical protein
MMAELKPFEFFLLRYVPDAVKNEFVNIGVVLIEPGAGFADVRFTQDWGRVYCLDAQADVQWLQAMERDLRIRLNDVANRELWMKRVQESFSGMVQLSPTTGCLAEDPVKELAELARLYVETPATPAVKRPPTGRQLILRTMQDAFESAGVGKLMMRDISVEKYTKAGDPFKFDFGYRVGSALKLFQAVSMKTSVDATVTLAARYPKIAEGIIEKVKLDSWLIAVIDDDLDRSLQATRFALESLEDAGIRIAEAREMEAIAKTASVELRV